MQTKIHFTVMFCGFLTITQAQSVMLGGDITYSYQSVNTYSFDIELYSESLVGAILVGFGDGSSDTLQLTTYPQGPNLFYAMGSVMHTFPGPGTYNVNAHGGSLLTWLPSGSIINMPNSGSTPFVIQTEIILSPFITPNTGIDFLTMHNYISDSLGYYFHYTNFINYDNDSIVFSLEPVPGTNVGTSYFYPSQIGGSEYIDSAGILQVSLPQYSYYAMNIIASEYREVAPGQMFLVGTSQRVMLIKPFLLGTSLNVKKETFVFLNPFSDAINLPKNEVFILHMFDSQGRIIYQNHSAFDKVSIVGLQFGIYNLQLTGTKSGKQINQILIKE